MFKKYNYPDDVVISSGWKRLNGTIYDENDNQNKVWHTYEKPVEILKDFITIPCCFPQNVYLIPKALILEAGLWNEKLSKNDDREFFARVLEKASKHLLKLCFLKYNLSLS